MLVDKKLTISLEGDSIKNHENDFEIWQDKFLVVKQYGFLPIHFTKNFDTSCVINIKSLKDLESWCLRFNNEEDYLSFGNRQDHWAKMNNDSLKIQFYKCSSKEPVYLGVMKITWEQVVFKLSQHTQNKIVY